MIQDQATRRSPGHFRAFRLFGVDVELHVLLMPLLLVVAWFFATAHLPEQEGATTYSRVEYWVLGLGVSLLLFLSVLVHELAHVAAARLAGTRVGTVTVFFHSGTSLSDEPASTPWREMLVASAGPAATAVLAAAGWIGALTFPEVRYAAPLLRFLGVTNLLFGLAYLIPVYPLDGGRMLRAVLWGLTGSLLTGTRGTVLLGRGVAILIGIGCLLPVPGVPAWLRGLGFALALVLWLLAGNLWRVTRTRERLRGLTAEQLMEQVPLPLPRIVSVEDALGDPAMAQRLASHAFLVEYNGRLGGIVTLAALRQVPTDERASTPVGQVTHKLRKEHLLGPATLVDAALRRMILDHLPVLPVVREGSLVGVLSRDAILRVIQGEDPRFLAWAAGAR